MKQLPPKYYLQHFSALLEFVEHRYQPLLLSHEHAFITRYYHLSEPAQCLLVRLINRRGNLFRLKRLDYPEIPNLTAALDELCEQQLTSTDSAVLSQDILGWLDCFTCNELMQLFKLDKQSNKTALLEAIQDDKTLDIAATLSHFETVVALCVSEIAQVIKFLYFGSLQRDMEQFVLRDLGQLQFENLSVAELPAYFQSRKQIEDGLRVRQASQQYWQMVKGYSAIELAQWFNHWCQQHSDLHSDAQHVLARLGSHLASKLERAGQYELALQCYAHSKQPLARERRVRLLAKMGATQAALELCAEMQNQPGCGGEQIFAQDYAKALQSGKRRRASSRYLKQAECLVLPLQKHGSVEQQVLHYFEQQGWQGSHSENWLWRSLLGLVIWEELFATAILNPFSRSSVDLWSAEFYTQRAQALDTALVKLQDDSSDWLQKRLQEKWGTVNSLVAWKRELPQLLSVLCRYLTPGQLIGVLQTMLYNVPAQSHGFPDLLLYHPTLKRYKLIEVKAPRDQLSNQQLFWLQRMQALGIQAQVLKVREP